MRWRASSADHPQFEEAIEYPRGAAQFKPSEPLKLLWYGHTANHDTLQAGISALAHAKVGPIDLMVISNAPPGGMNGDLKAYGIRAAVEPWSITAQYEALIWCDCVFVPSLDTQDKLVKGHNRVVEAINAGRVAITHPLPQYRELADYSFCDANYGASIRAARADPKAALQKLEQGQRYIDTRFAPEVVAEKWGRLIESL
jgi:hypothetical protein